MIKSKVFVTNETPIYGFQGSSFSNALTNKFILFISGVTTTAEDNYLKWADRIESFNKYGLPIYENGPNSKAVHLAHRVLNELRIKRIEPTQIKPTPDESIVFEFLINNSYRLIEVFNDGDMVFLKRDLKGNREAFDISFEDFKDKLGYYLNG